MISLTDLFQEFALRVVQVKVSRLTVKELTRYPANGQDGDVSLGSLCLELSSRKLLLGRQSTGQEAHHHRLLLVRLLYLSNLSITCLTIVFPELLVSLPQIVRYSIAAILHTVEQRHHIGMVHVTRAGTTGDELIGGVSIECHRLDLLGKRQGFLILH